MIVQFSKISIPESGTVVFGIGDDLKMSAKTVDLDKKTGGAIDKAIKSADFKGKKGTFLTILATVGLSLDRIVLVGLGDKKDKKINENWAVNLGGKIQHYLDKQRVKEAVIVIEDKAENVSVDTIAANIGLGALLRSYAFHKYFTKLEADKKPALEALTIQLEEHEKAAESYTPLESIAEGVFVTRDLVSEPPNVLHPEQYAERCRDLKDLGLKVEVLGERDMNKLGMGALLGVGQGSAFESKLVVMQWNGAPKGADQTPIAFVGKGVTFDTGGISIKPSNGMEEMKYDMAGSGAVVGLMCALAGRKAKINAVGVVGLVENMPGSAAQRPSDVVMSMSGQTIEVLNTDAEGRLVLADALWYTQDKFKPRFMVNLATLTGAIVVALSHVHAGLFSNNDELSERLLDAGRKTGETLWRMPMGKAYDKMIDSKTADVQNISNDKGAGSTTAAQFLQRFVNDVPWAHLDIAGVAWTKKPKDSMPEGATGFGVRLLDQMVRDHYEA